MRRPQSQAHRSTRKKALKRSPANDQLKDRGLEDIGAKLELRRHPGARRLTLRVSRTRRAVVVTIPLQCDLDEAGSFLNRHINWVRERLDSLPDPVPFAHNAIMPIRGEPHRIVFTGSASTRIITCHEPSNPLRCQWREIHVPGPRAAAPRRLRDWLFDQARKDLDTRVMVHAKKLNLRPKKIAVRDQTSRWGSCSTTGLLSFCWRLVLAPAHVLDYVAAHEVAHLAEMNHGAHFWALVDKAIPDTSAAKSWLQVFGPDLHRYGPANDLAA
jgi:predicted metal-dependent hydrolase